MSENTMQKRGMTKPPERIISAILIFSLFLCIFSCLPSGAGAIETLSCQNLVISLGGNERELIFSWADDQSSGKTALREAGKGSFIEYEAATSAFGAGYIHKTTVGGLKSSASYEYKLIGADKTESEVFSFKTGSPSKYSFLAVGDPQIASAANGRIWRATLSAAVTNFPNAAFLIGTGDQVDNYRGNSAFEYAEFFSPGELHSLPTAFAVGNHDNGLSLHAKSFYFPNTAAVGPGATNFDFWFRYGSTLFMVLDSNVSDTEAHKTFLDGAVKANSDAVWKIVIFHHSLYSEGPHSVTADTKDRRNSWPFLFDEIGADLIISGHDHCYTRTHMMKGNKIAEEGSGTLYITLNSSSGSKYYDFAAAAPAAYSAVRGQSRAPEFSVIDVNDAELTISVYRADTMKMTDTYTIAKDPVQTGTGTGVAAVSATFLAAIAAAVFPDAVRSSLTAALTRTSQLIFS